ncbi:MAG: HAD family hydrolase [Myxococcales bacterium]|nr:HAD family hydrolase [Polyangiaceae bacterium]MDW8251300.1 HAD family hydrolase [Myxococcales bacterium]
MRGASVPCAGCGTGLDALRAGHVAHVGGRFVYFCGLPCRQCYARQGERSETSHRSARRPAVAIPAESVEAMPMPERSLLAHSSPLPRFSSAPIQLSLPSDIGLQEKLPEADPGELDALLLFMAAAAGGLSIVLVLLGTTHTITGARALVAAVGAAALVGRVAVGPRAAGDGPRWLVAGPGIGAGLALGGWALRESLASDAAVLAGVLVLATAIQTVLQRRLAQKAAAERAWIAAALELPGRRVDREDLSIVAAHELRPGEFLRVEAGEIVPADLQILAGSAIVLPWLGATTPVRRGGGDTVIAGARLLDGSIEGVATWTGYERAWARLLLDPKRGVEEASSLAVLARSLAFQGSLGAALLTAMATYAMGGGGFAVLLSALAAYGALATTAVATLPCLHLLHGVLAAARHGISYRDAAAWDAAGRVASAIFLARGTLLLGEPDVVEIEPFGRYDTRQLLAWVAGAEAHQTHPIALAVQRASRARAVTPDAVRSPVVVPGLGIKSITSTGQTLLVGSRALMLEERVSIAMAEERATELEGLGRTVLLVAVGGRLAGLVALQDGLRPGARASVQHLLDSEIEPILLSGDSRETCETIGRSLDIEHIRPEILPGERAAEVHRLVESGAGVAVFGRPASDGPALGAATVAVALEAAGTSPCEWHVNLVGDDIRDGALALTLAHRARSDARSALGLAMAPGVLGTFAIIFGLLPPVFAPLAGLLGGFFAATHARLLAARRPEQPLTPWDLRPPSL